MEDLILPLDLREHIRLLCLTLSLYEQWCIIINELRNEWHHEIYNWPKLDYKWTIEDFHAQSCWIKSITRLYWYGNRISVIQYGDNMYPLGRGVNQEGIQIFELILNAYHHVYIFSSSDDKEGDYIRHCEKMMHKYGSIAILTIDEEKIKSHLL